MDHAGKQIHTISMCKKHAAMKAQPWQTNKVQETCSHEGSTMANQQTCSHHGSTYCTHTAIQAQPMQTAIKPSGSTYTYCQALYLVFEKKTLASLAALAKTLTTLAKALFFP